MVESFYIKPLSVWQKSIALTQHFQNNKAIVLLILSSWLGGWDKIYA